MTGANGNKGGRSGEKPKNNTKARQGTRGVLKVYEQVWRKGDYPGGRRHGEWEHKRMRGFRIWKGKLQRSRGEHGKFRYVKYGERGKRDILWKLGYYGEALMGREECVKSSFGSLFETGNDRKVDRRLVESGKRGGREKEEGHFIAHLR